MREMARCEFKREHVGGVGTLDVVKDAEGHLARRVVDLKHLVGAPSGWDAEMSAKEIAPVRNRLPMLLEKPERRIPLRPAEVVLQGDAKLLRLPEVVERVLKLVQRKVDAPVKVQVPIRSAVLVHVAELGLIDRPEFDSEIFVEHYQANKLNRDFFGEFSRRVTGGASSLSRVARR